MNNTSSLEQISKRRILDASLKLRPHKIDLMSRFMEIESLNPKMKQKEIAREIGYSFSTLQRYRIFK